MDPEEQLQSFIQKFEPQHQAVIRAARKKLRKRFPTATELAYDNYNFFVIGFGPSERPSECIVTIAAAANGVGLCFVRGASLRARCCLVPASRLAFFAFPQQRSSIGPMFTGFCQLLPSARRRHFPAPDGGSLLFAQFQGSGDLVENRDSPNQSMKPRP